MPKHFNAGFIGSLPAAVLSMVTGPIIDAAKEAGFALVTRAQDGDDLLAGFYEVKGREQISIEKQIETNVDRLAHDWQRGHGAGDGNSGH